MRSAHIQPVELAEKAGQGDGRPPNGLGLARLRAQRVHRLPLPRDREQFESYELAAEAPGLPRRAGAEERYALLTPPKVKMETDDDLDMGEFGPRGWCRPKGAPPAEEGIPEPQELPGATMVPAARLHRGRHAGRARRRARAGLRHDRRTAPPDRQAQRRRRAPRPATSGSRTPTSRATMRRSARKERPTGSSSAHPAVEVNGKRVKRAKLEDTDRMTVGSTG